MGITSSQPRKEEHQEKGSNSRKQGSSSSSRSEYVDGIKAYIEDEIARRAMIQREVQMAISVAQARDSLWIFGSAWLTLVTGVGVAGATGHRPPSFVALPIVIGGLALGNMADMAYGNKMQRVTKEAEYLLENEKGRFVPIKQAPFAKFYTDNDRAMYYNAATPVGELFPMNYMATRGIQQDSTTNSTPTGETAHVSSSSASSSRTTTPEKEKRK